MRETHEEPSERLRRQIEAIRRTIAALHARTHLDELERQTLVTAAEVVGASAGSLLLHDPSEAQLVFRSVIGPASIVLMGQAIPEDKGVAGQVFQSGQARITQDGGHPMVTLPLKTPRGQLIGVLQLLDKQQGAFDTDDLAVLEILASLAAFAIDTARLHEEARLAEVVHRIADISHDIRNMVTPVQTGTQTLELMLQATFADLDGILNEPGTPPELAARIRSACEGVRDWYPEAVQMTYDGTTATQERVRELGDAIKGIVAVPQFEEVNANKVAELVAKTLRTVAEKAGVMIDLSGLGDVPVADLDWKRVHSALYNLVNNAIPETPRGGTIFLRTSVVTDEASEKRLQIEVADTGRGMPEHVRARLFTDQAASTKPGGTGLGTQIVKSAVEAHQGTVTVQSQEGVGTTFSIRLPLHQSPDATGAEEARRQQELAIARALQQQQQREAEREQRARLQQELAIGRRIQMSLLAPQRLCLEGFEILSRSEPATEVGGDFYNVFPLRRGIRSRRRRSAVLPSGLGITLGDVAGKGVGAALLMAVTTTLIQSQAQLLPSPAATLEAANAELYPKMRPPGGQPLFVTAIYGVLDPIEGEIRLANAGQTPPIYWPATGEPRYVRVKGLPLGALSGSTYEEGTLHLSPGDRLLFCSDGFIEERNAGGEAVGYQGFLRLLERLGRRSGPELIEALFTAGDNDLLRPDEPLARDDRTLVLVTAAASSGV